MVAWLLANWVSLAIGILAVLEVVSLVVPGSSGTLAGLIKALAALPGVKDPGVGK
jgi:hypothetical protein